MQKETKGFATDLKNISRLLKEAGTILKETSRMLDIVSRSLLDRTSQSEIQEKDKEALVQANTKERSRESVKGSDRPHDNYDFRTRGFLYPLSLLQSRPADRDDTAFSAEERLESILDSLKIRAKVEKAIETPMMTIFGLAPEPGVKVSSIKSKKEELGFNLHCDIEFQIPLKGTSLLGVLAYKQRREQLYLRETVGSQEFQEQHAGIPILLGMDMNGNIRVADLTELGGVLVVGGTGSGKSTFLHGFLLTAFLVKRPEEVKMILVDTRNVEFSIYNGIPNMLIPAVVGAERAVSVLQWAVRESRKRLAEGGSFNGISVIIVIDELSDLMLFYGKETEEAIQEIATYSADTGIYLILASQWISQDVITEDIKRKIPACVAFRVSSGKTSQTLFGIKGAEGLIGDGDMLFFPKTVGESVRIQAAMVNDQEIKNVVSYLKRNANDNLYDEMLLYGIMKQIDALSHKENKIIIEEYDQVNEGDKDEYFDDAARLIVESGKSSIGMVQRKFKISFNRAAKIMDALSEAGVVGPGTGIGPRAILMNMAELEDYLRTR